MQVTIILDYNHSNKKSACSLTSSSRYTVSSCQSLIHLWSLFPQRIHRSAVPKLKKGGNFLVTNYSREIWEVQANWVCHHTIVVAHVLQTFRMEAMSARSYYCLIRFLTNSAPASRTQIVPNGFQPSAENTEQSVASDWKRNLAS